MLDIFLWLSLIFFIGFTFRLAYEREQEKTAHAVTRKEFELCKSECSRLRSNEIHLTHDLIEATTDLSDYAQEINDMEEEIYNLRSLNTRLHQGMQT